MKREKRGEVIEKREGKGPLRRGYKDSEKNERKRVKVHIYVKDIAGPGGGSSTRRCSSGRQRQLLQPCSPLGKRGCSKVRKEKNSSKTRRTKISWALTNCGSPAYISDYAKGKESLSHLIEGKQRPFGRETKVGSDPEKEKLGYTEISRLRNSTGHDLLNKQVRGPGH